MRNIDEEYTPVSDGDEQCYYSGEAELAPGSGEHLSRISHHLAPLCQVLG